MLEGFRNLRTSVSDMWQRLVNAVYSHVTHQPGTGWLVDTIGGSNDIVCSWIRVSKSIEINALGLVDIPKALGWTKDAV